MTVSDLALKLDVKAKDVMKKLMEKTDDGDHQQHSRHRHHVDDRARVRRDVKMQTFEEELLQVETDESNPEDIVKRGPVVTVMGHVDHGKTTLLDAIRETRVAEREAGGITQHIGAYAVRVNDRNVGVPRHPRPRGVHDDARPRRVARHDVVVLVVVAADDGVMPQTREAIDHAARGQRADSRGDQQDRQAPAPTRTGSRRNCRNLGLVQEDWGGQTVTVPLSAKKRENIPALLEMVLLVTELSELKANPKRNASARCSKRNSTRGAVRWRRILVRTARSASATRC